MYRYSSDTFTVLVQMEEPVLKLEVKPFVGSWAVSNNVTLHQRPVNRRPIFLTMQPLVISNGAKMEQVWQGCFPFLDLID